MSQTRSFGEPLAGCQDGVLEIGCCIAPEIFIV